MQGENACLQRIPPMRRARGQVRPSGQPSRLPLAAGGAILVRALWQCPASGTRVGASLCRGLSGGCSWWRVCFPPVAPQSSTAWLGTGAGSGVHGWRPDLAPVPLAHIPPWQPADPPPCQAVNPTGWPSTVVTRLHPPQASDPAQAGQEWKAGRNRCAVARQLQERSFESFATGLSHPSPPAAAVRACRSCPPGPAQSARRELPSPRRLPALPHRAALWYGASVHSEPTPPFFWVGGGEIRSSDLGRRGFTVRFRV